MEISEEELGNTADRHALPEQASDSKVPPPSLRRALAIDADSSFKPAEGKRARAARPAAPPPKASAGRARAAAGGGGGGGPSCAAGAGGDSALGSPVPAPAAAPADADYCGICFQIWAPSWSKKWAMDSARGCIAEEELSAACDDKLICDGGCHRSFHIGCLRMPFAELLAVQARDDEWMCEPCAAAEAGAPDGPQHACNLCGAKEPPAYVPLRVWGVPGSSSAPELCAAAAVARAGALGEAPLPLSAGGALNGLLAAAPPALTGLQVARAALLAGAARALPAPRAEVTAELDAAAAAAAAAAVAAPSEATPAPPSAKRARAAAKPKKAAACEAVPSLVAASPAPGEAGGEEGGGDAGADAIASAASPPPGGGARPSKRAPAALPALCGGAPGALVGTPFPGARKCAVPACGRFFHYACLRRVSDAVAGCYLQLRAQEAGAPLPALVSDTVPWSDAEACGRPPPAGVGVVDTRAQLEEADMEALWLAPGASPAFVCAAHFCDTCEHAGGVRFKGDKPLTIRAALRRVRAGDVAREASARAARAALGPDAHGALLDAARRGGAKAAAAVLAAAAAAAAAAEAPAPGGAPITPPAAPLLLPTVWLPETLVRAAAADRAARASGSPLLAPRLQAAWLGAGWLDVPAPPLPWAPPGAGAGAGAGASLIAVAAPRGGRGGAAAAAAAAGEGEGGAAAGGGGGGGGKRRASTAAPPSLEERQFEAAAGVLWELYAARGAGGFAAAVAAARAAEAAAAASAEAAAAASAEAPVEAPVEAPAEAPAAALPRAEATAADVSPRAEAPPPSPPPHAAVEAEAPAPGADGSGGDAPAETAAGDIEVEGEGEGEGEGGEGGGGSARGRKKRRSEPPPPRDSMPRERRATHAPDRFSGDAVEKKPRPGKKSAGEKAPAADAIEGGGGASKRGRGGGGGGGEGGGARVLSKATRALLLCDGTEENLKGGEEGGGGGSALEEFLAPHAPPFLGIDARLGLHAVSVVPSGAPATRGWRGAGGGAPGGAPWRDAIAGLPPRSGVDALALALFTPPPRALRRGALAAGGLPDPSESLLLCAGAEQRDLYRLAVERSALPATKRLFPCVHCPRWYHFEHVAPRKKGCLPKRESGTDEKHHFCVNAFAFLCPVHMHLHLPGDKGEGEEPLELEDAGAAEGEDAAGGGRRVSEATKIAARRAAAAVRDLPLPPDAAPVALEDDPRHFRYPAAPFDAEVDAWRYEQEKPLEYGAISKNQWPPELRVRALRAPATPCTATRDLCALTAHNQHLTPPPPTHTHTRVRPCTSPCSKTLACATARRCQKSRASSPRAPTSA
jgi:hypothetical protein